MDRKACGLYVSSGAVEPCLGDVSHFAFLLWVPFADRLPRWLKASSRIIEMFGIYSRYPARCCWGDSTLSRLQSENTIYNTSQKAANDTEEEKMKFKAIWLGQYLLSCLHQVWYKDLRTQGQCGPCLLILFNSVNFPRVNRSQESSFNAWETPGHVKMGAE